MKKACSLEFRPILDRDFSHVLGNERQGVLKRWKRGKDVGNMSPKRSVCHQKGGYMFIQTRHTGLRPPEPRLMHRQFDSFLGTICGEGTLAVSGTTRLYNIDVHHPHPQFDFRIFLANYRFLICTSVRSSNLTSRPQRLFERFLRGN